MLPLAEPQIKKASGHLTGATKKHILLLAIFVFAFSYRIFLLFGHTYPPGSDIGFHAGVINSITRSGNTNFLWNFYNMGGGLELEFPGFHIFASEIMFLTGLPNYAVQACVAALFSSFTVLAIFLVTRIMLNESTAFIAAFFVAISATDIEIICWSGYPNITVLFLIPLTFYLFLKRDKITQLPFLASTSLLTAAIFLTHSLSAAVFLGVTIVTLLVVLAFPKPFNETRKNMLYLALPLFVGAALVSPFLVNAVPAFLSQSWVATGSPAIDRALVLNRTVPLEAVVALFASIVPFFLLSKRIKGRFFSFPVFLLVIWLFVPLILTQDYLVGLYVDAIRFPYFLIYPVLILLAVSIDYGSTYFAKALGTQDGSNEKNKISLRFLSRPKPKRSTKTKAFYAIFIVTFLLVALFILPIFRFPWDGVKVQNFYQVMDNQGYQAIEWAKQNTSPNAVFVSDMGYGWWLAGVGQRPTLTNVDLQASTLAREVSVSMNVSYLIDTDYVIDNGYIQVREDGGYVGRHNPIFLADLNWTDKPYGFFQFNSSEITLVTHNEKNANSTNLANLPVTGMQLIGANSNSPSIIVNKANSAFNYSEITTVTKGNLLANMTIIVQSNQSNNSLDWLNFIVDSQGIFQQQINNTVAILDPSTKEMGQLIFAKAQPTISNLNPQNPCITQLSYNLQGQSKAEIQILVGMHAVADHETQNPSMLREILSANQQNPATAPILPVSSFDYKTALQQYNVSYIVNRDFDLTSKYARDPLFSLAFINNEVAIYKIEANANTP